MVYGSNNVVTPVRLFADPSVDHTDREDRRGVRARDKNLPLVPMETTTATSRNLDPYHRIQFQKGSLYVKGSRERPLVMIHDAPQPKQIKMFTML